MNLNNDNHGGSVIECFTTGYLDGSRHMPMAYNADEDKITGIPDKPTLLSVCFEPTNRCPGRCPYCLIERHQQDHSTSDLTQLLSELIATGTMRIGFGGGEPMLRADIFELGQLVRREFRGSLLRTSGMFPMDSSAATSFDWIDVSFDSCRREIFERCRPGVPYDVLTANIEQLAGSTRLRASILITSINYNDVLDTVRWLSDVGVRAVRLQRLVRRGRAVRNWLDLAVPDREVEQRIRQAVALGEELKTKVFELKSIGKTTLAIVKADGSIYAATPGGLRQMGSAFSTADREDLAVMLADAQMNTYLEFADGQ